MNRNRNNTVFVLLAFALGLVGATARDTAMIKQHDALTMKEVALLETGVYGDGDGETDTKAEADMQATEAEAETKAPGLKAIVREIFNHTKKAPLTAMREMKVTLDGFKNKYAVGGHSYCGKEMAAAKKAECTSEAVTVSNKTKSLIGYVDNYIKKKEAYSKMTKLSPMKAPARLAYEGYWAGIRIKGLFHEHRKINLHKKFKCMSICADFFRDHPEGVEGGTAAIEDSLGNDLKSDCCVEQVNTECNIGLCTKAQVTIISAARTALASTPYFQKLGDYIHESRKKKSGTVQRFAAATAVTSGDVKETAVKVLETTAKVVVFAAVVAACVSFFPICIIVVLLSML